MKKLRFSETQIVSILNEADAGIMVQDICRQPGTCPATFHRWKSKYGGMATSDLKRMKELESENATPKRMFADLSLENDGLKDLIQKKL